MPAQDPASPRGEPNIDIGTPYTPRRPTPVVSISINHPIGTMLRKIKNFLTHKQTLFSTTFNIKVTPIVAIVSILGIATVFGGGITTAYTFGKTMQDKFLSSLPSPTPKIVNPIIIISQAGVIKATYHLPPNAEPSPIPTETSGSGSAEITSIPTPTPNALHYILVTSTGSITFLNSSSLSLENYVNLKVLITGMYDSSKNTLTITKTEDIEILQ